VKSYNPEYISSNLQMKNNGIYILRSSSLYDPIEINSELFGMTIAKVLSEDVFIEMNDGLNLLYNNGNILGYS